jgi:hypothetical protein
MNVLFKVFLFDKLPAYFRRNDSNKDLQGQGTLERYMGILGSELDEEIIPLIENYLDIVDAQITPERFLVPLSDSLGNPPDISQNLDEYRNILSYIVTYYKIKGTEAAYQLFFSLLGFNVTITEIEPIDILYDINLLYDEDDILLYDSQCPTCSCYLIEFSNVADSNNNINPITPETIALLHEAIEFNEPINACLDSLTHNIVLLDDLSLCIKENLIVNTIGNNLYDDSLLYDDGNTYDDNILSTVLDISQDSGLCTLPEFEYNSDYNNDYTN